MIPETLRLRETKSLRDHELERVNHACSAPYRVNFRIAGVSQFVDSSDGVPAGLIYSAVAPAAARPG
jgi:hypothetical protein